MRPECIDSLIICNRDIEFAYNGKMYSITKFTDGRPDYISFCEFFKEPVNVCDSDSLMSITVEGKTLKEILSKLPDDAFMIN